MRIQWDPRNACLRDKCKWLGVASSALRIWTPTNLGRLKRHPIAANELTAEAVSTVIVQPAPETDPVGAVGTAVMAQPSNERLLS